MFSWLVYMKVLIFFFQAEDGIRDAQESRGLGDVYKRQIIIRPAEGFCNPAIRSISVVLPRPDGPTIPVMELSLIHI